MSTWTDVSDLISMRCCSARGSADVTIPASGSSGDFTVKSGAKMKKIPLDTWANRNDTTLFTFSNGGVKLAEAGDYLISASLCFTNAGTKDNHGIYIVDSSTSEIASAHYYNANDGLSNGSGLSPKILTFEANTILYLCTYSQTTASPIVRGANSATFLTIIKL